MVMLFWLAYLLPPEIKMGLRDMARGRLETILVFRYFLNDRTNPIAFTFSRMDDASMEQPVDIITPLTIMIGA
jgi:hypothetical protein